ncbi:phage tail fiber protein [Serratia sp. IR-2025]
MIIGFGNNVVSSLAADITATQTTIQVMPGAGALFAGLLTYDYANDSNPLKVYAKITLTDAKETVFEVCHLTAVNNDMLTVVRGQEGTAAKGWSLNDVIANFATRGSENQFVQIEQLQSGHYTSAVAGGTANGLTLALPATFFLNGSTEWALKTPILIYPTLNNTGASTLQLTMGGRVMGTYPLVKGSNTALRAGDIVAKNPFLAVFNADQGRFIVLNPTTDVGSVRSVNAIGPDAGGNVALPMYGLGMGPQHKDDAFSNVAQIYRINSSSASTPGGSVYGVICLPCDGAPSAAYLGAGNNGELHVGRSTTASKGVLWNRVYTTAYKPTAADINAVAKTGDRMSGALGSTYTDTYRIVAGQYGTFWRNDGSALYLMLTNAGDQWGAFNNLRPFAVSTSDGSINVGTSFSVNYTGYINKLGINPYTNNGQSFNQTNGLHIQGAGDQYGDIYYLETVGKYGSLSFHIHGGGLDAYPAFNNNGSLSLNGSWPAISNSAGTTWHPDGNVEGPQWGGYLSNWLNQNISNAQNNAQNWAYQNLVQNVRLTGRINQPDTGDQVRVPDGCVFTGMSGANYDPSIWASYSYVQVLINGSWRNIGTS